MLLYSRFIVLFHFLYSTSRIINLVTCWKWCLNTKQKWTIEATTIPTLLVFLSTTLKRSPNDVKVNTIALQLWNLCHHILLVLKERNILPTQKESITFTHEPETNIYLCRRKMFWEVWNIFWRIFTKKGTKNARDGQKYC